ncbi:MAG: hypothetical protein AABY22_08225 [Nanoarchaeota archaeon]
MEKIKLSQWAKENSKTYKQSWQMIQDGNFPEEITRNKNGGIFVIRANSHEQAIQNIRKEISFVMPAQIDWQGAGTKIQESKASVRRNKTATSSPTDPYYHIENSIDPYQSGRGSKSNNDYISVYDAIRLCQKCYFFSPIYSQVIDVLTEFSTSNIYLRDGNKKSRSFFNALFKKINIIGLEDKFFREYYRSSNVFPYRFEAILKDDDLKKINTTYGTKAAKETKLPVKYVILNPCDIVVSGNISFASGQFYKRLTPYEVQRMKKPITDDDNNLLNSLSPEIQKQIKEAGLSSEIQIPLDSQYIYAIFYRKQDYEALAIPIGFSVLGDINAKAEMKAIDLAVNRTLQRYVLLVTTGSENKNGEYMVDAKAIEALRALFESESIGKTLVADFTTKVSFVIPDIGNILDPKKYEIINEDILTGLNHILTGTNEKFANQSIKVKLFIQRLKQSREAFLNEFLNLEIKRISKDMNFKSYPEAFFQDIDFKDQDLWNRIITQLTQMGILTAEESFNAIETGQLPTNEESLESQEKFKEAKDKGFYEPIVGGAQSQKEMLDTTNKQQIKMTEKQQEHDSKMKTKELKHKAENPEPVAPQFHIQTSPIKQPKGRPPGSNTPKSKNKISPLKGSEQHSLVKIKDNLILASELSKNIKDTLCEKFKIKELTKEQNEIAEALHQSILISEKPSNWNTSIGRYLNDPDYQNEEEFEKVEEIAYQHQVDYFLAAILKNSKIED